jgi:GST-like protein
MKKIQLYSFATPNGQKVGIALEEMGLPYESHKVDIGKGDQFKPDFIRISPNSKIPIIVDPEGPAGKELSIMESGAILIYLAEKSGKYLSTELRERNETLQWLFFQVGHIGPMFGQFGHFYKYAKDKCDHPYPLMRYASETKRLLDVMDKRLQRQQYIAGNDYSIADMAIVPWVNCLEEFYLAGDYLELSQFKRVQEWVSRIWRRPSVQRGIMVCS